MTPRCENSLYVITRVLFLKSSEPVQIETMICFEKNKIYLLFLKIRNRITFDKVIIIWVLAQLSKITVPINLDTDELRVWRLRGWVKGIVL